MTPREKRERLFKIDRPVIRPFEMYEGNNFSKDIGRIWVAHQHNPFDGFPTDREGFIDTVRELSDDLLFVIDDWNREYETMGPVGFIWILTDGWVYEPKIEFFPWATTRNKLRSCISLFQWIRHLKTVGACIVHSDETSHPLFVKCKDYGVLFYVGYVKNGYPTGDRYIYTVMGKKHG